MATYSLFCSVSDIKDSSYLDENVDDKTIRVAILEAQRIHIRDIIGSDLYNELDSQKQSGTLTALNISLLAKIKDALVWLTLYEGMDNFNYKIRNKGVMKSNSDNSISVEDSQLTRLAQRFLDKAQYYQERLRLYLVENETSYPLYLNPSSGIDVIRPAAKTYRTGWVLGKRKDNCCFDDTIEL